MIENLPMVMSFFRLIKLLVRLLVRVVGTDWMFVFPRLHSQHASARSEGSPSGNFLGLRNGYNKNEPVQTRYTDYFRVQWQHSRLILARRTLRMSDAVWSPVGVNGRNQAAWNFIRATLWQTNNLQSRHHTLLLQSFLIKFSFGTSKCARNIFSPVFEDFMSVVMHLIH